MLTVNENERFILYGFSYSEEQVEKARKIRQMTNCQQMLFATKHFEVETGKQFPSAEPVELSLNLDTYCLSSREIARGAEEVIMNTRSSRKNIVI